MERSNGVQGIDEWLELARFDLGLDGFGEEHGHCLLGVRRNVSTKF